MSANQSLKKLEEFCYGIMAVAVAVGLLYFGYQFGVWLKP